MRTCVVKMAAKSTTKDAAVSQQPSERMVARVYSMVCEDRPPTYAYVPGLDTLQVNSILDYITCLTNKPIKNIFFNYIYDFSGLTIKFIKEWGGECKQGAQNVFSD